MANNFSMKFDTSGLNAALDKLADGAKEQVRPAAQAGAQVLYEEVRLNVSRLGKKSGNLYASIYQVFSKDNSDEKKSTYHVSWNAKKAPHGHLIENGTSRSPAYPFVRPAYDAAAARALQASKEAMESGVREVISGLKS